MCCGVFREGLDSRFLADGDHTVIHATVVAGVLLGGELGGQLDSAESGLLEKPGQTAGIVKDKGVVFVANQPVFLVHDHFPGG